MMYRPKIFYLPSDIKLTPLTNSLVIMCSDVIVFESSQIPQTHLVYRTLKSLSDLATQKRQKHTIQTTDKFEVEGDVVVIQNGQILRMFHTSENARDVVKGLTDIVRWMNGVNF